MNLKILKVIRLHIVAGGAFAFSIGALLAATGGEVVFDPLFIMLCYVVVLLGDLSTHYSNDFFDVEVDKLIKRRKFFTGSAILVANPRLRSAAKWISFLLVTLSTILAVVMVLFYQAPIELLLIALGENFLGWAYSAPPFRLVSRGVGEIAVAVVTGFAIPSMGYLALKRQIDSVFGYFALPFILYGLMLSLSLGAPDQEIDRKGGKKNLIVRKGKTTVFVVILAAALLATVMFSYYVWYVTLPNLSFLVVGLFSLLPLTAGFVGFAGVLRKKDINRYSTLNVASLFLFNLLMIAYLAVIVSTT